MDWLHVSKLILGVGAVIIGIWFPTAIVLCVWAKEPANSIWNVWIGGSLLIGIPACALSAAFAVLGWALS